MTLTKHISLAFSLIAILFISDVCSAAPSIKNSFQTAGFSNYTLSQNQHLTESQETGCYESASYDKDDSYFSCRVQNSHRLFKRASTQGAFEFHETCFSKFPCASYNPLLRPAYYTLLFRNYLF